PLYGFRAPVRTDVAKELGCTGKEMAKEHGRAVQRVVLRREDERLADAVPVPRRAEDGLREVVVREVVGPLPLTLEACRQCIVAERLLTVAHFGELRVSYHEVSRYERHLDVYLPILIFL